MQLPSPGLHLILNALKRADSYIILPWNCTYMISFPAFSEFKFDFRRLCFMNTSIISNKSSRDGVNCQLLSSKLVALLGRITINN